MKSTIDSVFPVLPEGGLNVKEILSSIEKDLIAQALIRTEGNKTQAARLLTMNRTTLLAKMRSHGFRLKQYDS